MTPQIAIAEERQATVWAAKQQHPSETRVFTRQPILDAQGRVFGYEVLAGAGPCADGDEDDRARMVIDDIVLFGAERIGGSLPLFIRCSAEAVLDRMPLLLPPAVTVVEIPQSVAVTEKLIEACVELRGAGYRLALADCMGDPAGHALLDLADYVKADFICMDAAALANLRQRLAGKVTALIAENLQWAEDGHAAAEAGFSYFQGSCLADPEALRYAKVPANRALHIMILQQLFPSPLDSRELLPLLKRDASLVYRLLRLANTPICATRRKAESLQDSMLLLGEDTVRRAALLAIQCEMDAEPSLEAVPRAMVRARFCELAAPLAKLNPGEQYLVGMLSMLPAMLRSHATVQARELSLRPAVVEALLGASVPERMLLDWIEALERNLSAECSRIAALHRLRNDKLEMCYLEALSWAEEESGLPRQ